MVYRLVLYNDKVVKSINFSKVPGFESLANYGLQNIINFTNSFNDGYEIIDTLYNFHIISKEDTTMNLGISAINGKNQKILPYGISVNVESEYFYPINLKGYLCTHIKDINFMNAFINRYYSMLNDDRFIWESIRYIKYAFDYYCNNHNLPEDTYNYISDFIEYFCYYHSKNHRNYKFSNIRDLAMFIINYERNLNNEALNQEEKEVANNIAMYQSYIDEGNITDEDALAYEEEIIRLERRLNHLDYEKGRKRKHETSQS